MIRRCDWHSHADRALVDSRQVFLTDHARSNGECRDSMCHDDGQPITPIHVASHGDLVRVLDRVVGRVDGGLGIRPAVQLNGRPDPVEIEKMRAGRLFLVSRSRIELFQLSLSHNDDDLAENSPAPQVRIADGAFDELVFGKGLTTEDAAQPGG